MKFRRKSTGELETELKTIKFVTGVLIGVLCVLMIVCVYGYATKEENLTFLILAIIPFALSPIVFLNVSVMKKIKAELESRK